MHTKLAGHLPLQEMIAHHIDAARAKVAAAEESDKAKEKAKKLIAYEKKEHGGKIPSEKEEEAEHEKTSSAFFQDPGSIEKLAEALEYVGEKLAGDSIVNGGEAKQGGEQLATMGVVPGKQPYKRDAAKHQVPAPGTQGTKDNPGPANAMATDESRAPGGNGAKYPAKGVLKTASESVMDRIAAKAAQQFDVEVEDGEEKTASDDHKGAKRVAKGALIGGAAAGLGPLATGAGGLAYGAGKHPKMTGKALKALAKEVGKHPGRSAKAVGTAAKIYGKAMWRPALGGAALGAAAGGAHHLYKKHKEKKSSAEFILNKLAEFHGGGETLDDQAAPVPSNAGRQMISSNKAPVSATKREAKAPRKVELKEVLTEPAMTSSTDSKVNENLRNASKGGVKIAAAKAYLQKVAEEGCTCGDKGECRHCKLAKAIEAKKKAS